MSQKRASCLAASSTMGYHFCHLPSLPVSTGNLRGRPANRPSQTLWDRLCPTLILSRLHRYLYYRPPWSLHLPQSPLQSVTCLHRPLKSSSSLSASPSPMGAVPSLLPPVSLSTGLWKGRPDYQHPQSPLEPSLASSLQYPYPQVHFTSRPDYQPSQAPWEPSLSSSLQYPSP